ncbi:MAG: RNA-binding transcriptional accessory protein [Candidatus Cloacimonadota bacterium]|nr:MAG: RNA-binding transcriptional accessory protein [Candidatus Cloacimonadota bacterium]
MPRLPIVRTMINNNLINEISSHLSLSKNGVQAVLKLFSEDASIPFIARYRKEATNQINEIDLREIEDLQKSILKREDRRESVLNKLEDLKVLNPQLRQKLLSAKTLSEIEDIYQPFKSSRKTKAQKARDLGLQKLADQIKYFHKKDSNLFSNYLNKDLKTEQEVINGVIDILADEINNNVQIRAYLRETLLKHAYICSKKTKNEDLKETYKDYYDFSQKVAFIPSYRLLALERGEKQKLLKLAFTLPICPIDRFERMAGFQKNQAYSEILEKSVNEAYKKYLSPSIEREVRSIIREKSQTRAISVFSKNLRDLLLTPPIKGKVILGIDPGFRSGCKCVVVDAHGNFLNYKAIYPHTSNSLDSQKTVLSFIQKYKVNLIVIGNGTASRETETFISNLISSQSLKEISYLIASEAGASVYSASKTAIEEFPDLDVTVRGAISIARRVQDSLAESVKIPPESIGVGMYQHDMNQKDLSNELLREVQSVVNHVGVDINTASYHLLSYVSGLSKTLAKNVYNYRIEKGSINSRKELLKIKGLGPKAFELCAGFLRIPQSKNPLDNTIIHPESYNLATDILKVAGFSLKDFYTDKESIKNKLKNKSLSHFVESLNENSITIETVYNALVADSLDPRDLLKAPMLKNSITKLEDLSRGTILQGTIRNIVDFGVFIDLGVKINGLLHKSQAPKHQTLLEQFSVGQVVDVEITDMDLKRNRISLSLIK